MKWFEGSINEAVATSKSKKAIFVVFVEGKDDTSNQVAHVIGTTEVSSLLEQEHFVAIRLESGSETYRFFAQIYQLVPVPSLFFIGENGTPLEIIAGSTTAPALMSKIDAVLVKAGKGSKHSSDNLIQAEQKANANSSAGNIDINKKTENEDIEVDTLNDNAVSGQTLRQETSDGNGAASSDFATNDEAPETTRNIEVKNAEYKNSESKQESTKELSAEEKVERAKQLIELQRKQRIEEEEKKERERELERRKMGRDVQKMRQKQQDLEIKQAHEERVREKAAEAAAREKVRQQIAQDKLERKQKELALQQQVQQQQQSQDQPKARAPLSSDATVTRIQFRLPSGNPHMGQFEPTSTLRSLRTYVAQNIDLPFRQFVMSMSFPRRELGSEDDDKTLLELELVPTAVILILPLKNSNVSTTVTSTQDVGLISRYMWTLFAPIIGIYNYIIGYFTGGTRQNADRQQGDSARTMDSSNTSDETATSGIQNMAESSGLFRRNLSNQGGTTIRTQGNIHRLHSGGDDNDENNTWNGNSTQQM